MLKSTQQLISTSYGGGLVHNLRGLYRVLAYITFGWISWGYWLFGNLIFSN